MRCPLCEGEVVRRTFEMPVAMSDLLIARGLDRDSYWQHLTTQHPDRFDEGVGS